MDSWIHGLAYTSIEVGSRIAATEVFNALLPPIRQSSVAISCPTKIVRCQGNIASMILDNITLPHNPIILAVFVSPLAEKPRVYLQHGHCEPSATPPHVFCDELPPYLSLPSLFVVVVVVRSPRTPGLLGPEVSVSGSFPLK